MLSINKKAIKTATVSVFLVFFSLFFKTNSLINTNKKFKDANQNKITTTKKIDIFKNYNYKLIPKTKPSNEKENISTLLPEISEKELDLSPKVKTPHKKHKRNIFETLACILFIFVLAICFLTIILFNLKIPIGIGLNLKNKNKHKKLTSKYKHQKGVF